MVEPERYFEQFNGLSPRALNTVFSGILDTFPTFTIEIPERLRETSIGVDDGVNTVSYEIAKDMESRRLRRNRSDYKGVIMGRVEGFLSRFAYTPSSFNSLVLGELSWDYTFGVVRTKSRQPAGFVHDLLDLDHPEGGGLFDPNRAPEVIMSCYRILKDLDEMAESAFDEAVEKMGEERMLQAEAILRELKETDPEPEDEEPRFSDLLDRFEEEYFGTDK